MESAGLRLSDYQTDRMVSETEESLPQVAHLCPISESQEADEDYDNRQQKQPDSQT